MNYFKEGFYIENYKNNKSIYLPCASIKYIEYENTEDIYIKKVCIELLSGERYIVNSQDVHASGSDPEWKEFARYIIKG